MRKMPVKELESKLKMLLEISKIEKEQKQKIIIIADNTHIIIEVGRIVRLESIGNYTGFYLSDGKKIIASKTLKNYETQLPLNIFFRIIRSHVININFVKSFTIATNPTVTMSDGTELEVSRYRKKDLIELMEAI